MRPIISTFLLLCTFIISFIIVSMQINHNPYYASVGYLISAILMFLLLYKADRNSKKLLKWGNILISTCFIIFGFMFAQSSIFMILPIISLIYLLGMLLVGIGVFLLFRNTDEPLANGKYTRRNIQNKIYNGLIVLLTVLILVFIGYMWSVETKSSAQSLYDGQVFMTGVLISIWITICLPLGIMSYKTRPKLVE